MPMKWGNKENERPGDGWANHMDVDIDKNDVAQVGSTGLQDKNLLMSEVTMIIGRLKS